MFLGYWINHHHDINWLFVIIRSYVKVNFKENDNNKNDNNNNNNNNNKSNNNILMILKYRAGTMQGIVVPQAGGAL